MPGINTEDKKDEKTIPVQALVDLMIKKLNEQSEKKKEVDIKEVHFKALDDLVNVNSLFTVAVFVGLSTATRGKNSLENRDDCDAGADVRKMLIVYEVLAFACFLLSSLLAKVIKLHLYLEGTSYLTIFGKSYNFIRKGLDMKDLMLVLAASASAGGIVLLTLSVINIVQIRIGLISCGSSESRGAVWAMCWIVGIALVIYVVSMAIAICASIESDLHKQTTQKSDDTADVVALQTGVSGGKPELSEVGV